MSLSACTDYSDTLTAEPEQATDKTRKIKNNQRNQSTPSEKKTQNTQKKSSVRQTTDRASFWSPFIRRTTSKRIVPLLSASETAPPSASLRRDISTPPTPNCPNTLPVFELHPNYQY